MLKNKTEDSVMRKTPTTKNSGCKAPIEILIVS
jgi:hypothetical protein